MALCRLTHLCFPLCCSRKHLLKLRVVRESGGGISFGQSVVRQLPVFVQVGWIDVLFALFTERKQRAFELLSKTRVVRAAAEEQS